MGSWLGAGNSRQQAGKQARSRQQAGNKQATAGKEQARQAGKQASRQAGKGENVEILLFCAAGENFFGY